MTLGVVVPAFIVADDTFSHVTTTTTRGLGVLLAIALALVITEELSRTTEAVLTAADVQRALLPGIFSEFATLCMCVTVGQAAIATVVGAITTVTALSTACAIGARSASITSVILISSSSSKGSSTGVVAGHSSAGILFMKIDAFLHKLLIGVNSLLRWALSGGNQDNGSQNGKEAEEDHPKG